MEVPFAGPHESFFDLAHDAFGIGIPLGIVARCEDPLEAKDRRSFHERLRGPLAAIV